MELTEARVALEAMCRRCINHEQCLGTGCQPKNEIKKTIEEAEVYKKALELMSEELASNKHCTCHPYCYIKEIEKDCALIEECHNSKWLFDYYLQKAREEE